MLVEYSLNIGAELDYARKWAYGRNPDYYDFSSTVGDCTSFASQCLYAGGAVMNYTRDIGWYYASAGDRAAAWAGAGFLRRFLLSNRGAGPFGEPVEVGSARPGDLIQLYGDGRFYHTLVVVSVSGGVPYVAAHSFDALDRPLTSYYYEQAYGIRIIGARRYA